MRTEKPYKTEGHFNQLERLKDELTNFKKLRKMNIDGGQYNQMLDHQINRWQKEIIEIEEPEEERLAA